MQDHIKVQDDPA